MPQTGPARAPFSRAHPADRCRYNVEMERRRSFGPRVAPWSTHDAARNGDHDALVAPAVATPGPPCAPFRSVANYIATLRDAIAIEQSIYGIEGHALAYRLPRGPLQASRPHSTPVLRRRPDAGRDGPGVRDRAPAHVFPVSERAPDVRRCAGKASGAGNASTETGRVDSPNGSALDAGGATEQEVIWPGAPQIPGAFTGPR